MLVRIIDHCGRDEPRIAELSALESISSTDVDHIIDMFADGQPAYIGEFEYQEIAA
jgi:hypothetical protein